MKSAITIGLVAAAIIGVIVLKTSKKDSTPPEQAADCPCSMIKSAQSNNAPQGAAPVE